MDADAKDAFRLTRDAYDTLAALGNAIRETRSCSRLIVTTRYWSESAFPGIDLLAEQLPQMDRDELRKKARNELKPDAAAEKTETLIGSAAGNPRLFEDLAAGQAPDAATFRDTLKLKQVLDTLSSEERTQLARLSVFHLPVPPSVALEVAGDGEFQRAVSLGLAQMAEPAEENGVSQLEVTALVRPMLESTFGDAEWETCYGAAARAVYKVWWEDSERPVEAYALEVVRLATLGRERRIACDLMENLAVRWNNRGRCRDTVRWVRFVVEQFEDYRLLSSVAVAERFLGDTVWAAKHLERALELQPKGAERERAFALIEAAKIRAQQGDIEGALDLYGNALEIEERVADEQGRSAALHQMAGLRAAQGDVEGALNLYRQSLEIESRIGNERGKAPTLHQIGALRAVQGDVEGALALYGQSLEIQERFGDDRGKGATLHQMAGLRAMQGDAKTAARLYRQSLEIAERIGDATGQAATLANLADLTYRDNAVSATENARQAARVLAEIRAWPDLIMVLGNLSAYDHEHVIPWLAQAVWLVLILRQPQPASIARVERLFHTLPSADPLQLPLAALAMLLFTNYGPEALQSENREKAAALLAIAAHNQSMTPEAVSEWIDEKIKDPGGFLRETLTALEALAPEPWIFDREVVIASLRRDTSPSHSG